LAGTYPQQFRRLVIMSPYIPPEQADLIATQPPETYRIYMNWGSYDIQELIPLIESFDDMMDTHGIAHQSRLFHEGHSWGLWRATIDEGLLFCEGVQSGDGPLPEVPADGCLRLAAFPNPFSSRLTLRLAGATGPTTISVYDLAGRRHHRGMIPVDEQAWSWQPACLPAGPCIIEVDDGIARTVTSAIHLAR
jgi:enterochelin esterase family protein